MVLARKLLRGFHSGPDETAGLVSEAYLKLHKAPDEVRPRPALTAVGGSATTPARPGRFVRPGPPG